jgi:chromosome partitioning protein
MLDDEFASEQIPPYVVPRASDIGGGLERLSVIPCSIRIDDFSTNMAKARHGYRSTDEFNAIFQRRRELLRRWLRANFDFTVIDCPPSIALQVKVFLTVADAFILPAIPAVRPGLAVAAGPPPADGCQDPRARYALVALPGAEQAAPQGR